MRHNKGLLLFTVAYLFVSCSKIDWGEIAINEVDGSFFQIEDYTVPMEEKGYMQKNEDGTYVISCIGIKPNGDKGPCVEITVPSMKCIEHSGKMQLSANKKASIRFLTMGGIIFLHSTEKASLILTGELNKGTDNPWFTEEEIYSGFLTIKLSTSSPIHLQLNEVEIKNIFSLYGDRP